MGRSKSLQAWKDGAFVFLLNRKEVIFMWARVPKCVDLQRGSAPVPFLNLAGMTTIALNEAFAGKSGRHFARHKKAAGRI